MTDVSLSYARTRSGDLMAGAARLRTPAATVYLRGALTISVVAYAYHYSLETLFRSLTSQTPLAYLGLVPVFSVFLAIPLIVPEATEPPIHDRQIDFIVGVPLLLAALAWNLVMPVRLSTMFWLWRLDIVTLPVFTAGVVALVFGTRTLWRLKIPLMFLVLAWPLPYTSFLVTWLNAFTNSTLSALNFVLHVVHHVARPIPSLGPGIYHVEHGQSGFQASVASACSGVNGFVGYALVGLAFLAIVSGTWLRKIVWLGCGLAASWASNVLRIFVVLYVGHLAGENFAIDVLHPVIGLVMFNAVVIAMLLAMRMFGLHTNLDRGRFALVGREAKRAVPKLRAAVVVLIVISVAAAALNSSLRSYDLVESTLGEPKLTAFTDTQTAPTGWTVAHTDTYMWAKPFFGETSTWLRFQFNWNGSAGTLGSATPVIADVINTSDLSSFSTYGIEACYRFHGFKLYSIQTVDLGHGVAGNALTYYNAQSKSDWTTVYWHWPVLTQLGKTRYERVTLMMINSGSVEIRNAGAAPGVARSLGLGVQNAISGVGTAAKLTRTRDFLIAFARSLIGQQGQASAVHGTRGLRSTTVAAGSAS